MKIVSQLDANGIFTGPAVADASPLEVGVYLIPAGAVDLPPPVVPEGFLARLVSGTFVVEPEPPGVVPEPPAVTAVTNAQGKAALIILGLDDEVEALIASIPDPVERKLTRNDYDNRLTWERSNLRLQAIAAALSFNLDDLFTLAAQQ